MKQLFPILIAIIATTIVLVLYMSKDQRKWTELEKKDKTVRLTLLCCGGVLFFFLFAMLLLPA